MDIPARSCPVKFTLMTHSVWLKRLSVRPFVCLYVPLFVCSNNKMHNARHMHQHWSSRPNVFIEAQRKLLCLNHLTNIATSILCSWLVCQEMAVSTDVSFAYVRYIQEGSISQRRAWPRCRWAVWALLLSWTRNRNTSQFSLAIDRKLLKLWFRTCPCSRQARHKVLVYEYR